ncbi:hypothetical protein HYH02_005535 [Chlamydomonas schloesseri]|uniref:Uncharacterized protein n=1 Tax=Chlamydomonas schloesseri TaxID=2026947 RepID=A0A835WME7_9CHLO|nr:hypothetical protein HYH02_005535 [Chlamydomonas schloesseri]|eukprot:KAG2449385.1 hypothetical protein HYH02_005535 [Chlamydomonas schloesseri]
MSRSSNRGPRADIALLRKLKADPNFTPSSLLNAGNDILEKANKLKGFVSQQRGKLGASTAKTEWLLAFQHLQAEHDEADRELSNHLQQLVDNNSGSSSSHSYSYSHGSGAAKGGDGGRAAADADARDMAEALAVLSAQSDACRSERQQLRSRVRGLSSVHGSLKAYGAPRQFTPEAAAVKSEMSALAAELQAALSQLNSEAAAVAAEAREAWPSALADGAAAGAGGGEGLGGGGGGGCGTTEQELEELEKMLARYPLASPDIKGRIREVFGALQDKYAERLETWRMEAERTAQQLLRQHQQLHQQAAAAAAAEAKAAAPGGAGGGLGRGRGSAIPGRGGPGAGAAAGEHLGGRLPPGAAAAGGRSGIGRGKSPAAAGGGGGSGGGSSTGPASVSSRAAAAGSSSSSRALQPVVVPASAAKQQQQLPADYDGDLEPLGDGDASAVASETGAATAGGGGAGGGSSVISGHSHAGWLLSGYGGWGADEHAAFVKHRERLMREREVAAAGSKPASREALMARIAALLPGGRSPAAVAAHDDWTTASRLAARRRRDLDGGWERERRQFLDDSASFLEESELVFFAEAEEAADRLVTELLRERAADELAERRAERARDEEVAAAERAAAEAAAAEARVLAEAAARADRAVKKEAVAAYRAELERQQAEAQARIEAAQREMEELAAEQAVYNKERVEWRQAEYAVKQERAKEAAAAAALEEEARLARLERLRLLVAPQVEADPARLLAPTAATAAAQAAAEEAEALRRAGLLAGAFNPVQGFTTEQVLRDQRFKVREALTRLGLHETEYGRAAIAAARPAQPPRLDNYTSDQRAAMLAKQACK